MNIITNHDRFRPKRWVAARQGRSVVVVVVGVCLQIAWTMQHSSGVIGKPDTVRPAKHNGGNIAGMYDLEQTLGKGHFAVVKMARHVFTGEQVAVKVIDKNKLEEVSRNHLYQEVSAIRLYLVSLFQSYTCTYYYVRFQ